MLSPKLKEMTEKGENTNPSLPGYPLYPESEDIFIKYYEEKDVDPEEISKNKDLVENEKDGSRLKKEFNDDFAGRDLDIPGSELDDKLEDIGSEDEENNYYSIGGDGHSNLDEDQGT